MCKCLPGGFAKWLCRSRSPIDHRLLLALLRRMRAGSASALPDRSQAASCTASQDASGLRPSRSPLEAEPAPRPPANDACRMIAASTHGSVVPRSVSYDPASICREPSAPDIHPRNRINLGFQGAHAHWPGVQGARPPLAARRAGDQHIFPKQKSSASP